ncbi:MAG: hypothetical protein AB7V18_19535 [Pyrinomonadaceae bacterium]
MDEITRLQQVIRDREAEIYRIRTAENRAAVVLDKIREELGLDPRATEHEIFADFMELKHDILKRVERLETP